MSYVTANSLHPYFRSFYLRYERAFQRAGASVDSPSGDGYLLRATLGGKAIILSADSLPLNSAVAQFIARDKLSTYQIAERIGIPIPKGIAFFAEIDRGLPTRVSDRLLVQHLDTALSKAFAEELGGGVALVVKPGRESKGIGISVCRDIAKVIADARAVLQYGRYGLVQEFVHGVEYRIVILDDSVLVSYIKHNPRLIGDGISTEEELIVRFNAATQRYPDSPPAIDLSDLPPLKADCEWNLKSVLAEGDILELALETANLSRGSWPQLTNEPPESVVTTARMAHQAAGMRFSGCDVRLTRAGKAVLLEINGNPGFNHLEQYSRDAVDAVTTPVVERILQLL
jgi:D-alanine-D-alanine ligase-like ATP-grasp enzyme